MKLGLGTLQALYLLSAQSAPVNIRVSGGLRSLKIRVPRALWALIIRVPGALQALNVSEVGALRELLFFEFQEPFENPNKEWLE